MESRTGTLITLLLVPWAGFVLFSCGPSRPQATAELLTALATKIQMPFLVPNPDPSASPSPAPLLPAQISCGNDVFTLNGGTAGGGGLTVTEVPTTGNNALVTLNLNLLVSGANIGQAASDGSSSSTSTTTNNVLCDVQAQFAIDTTFPGFSGLGTIPNCDHYSCIVDNQAVSCADLQSAMSSVSCN